MNKKTILIIVIVAVAIYFLFFHKKQVTILGVNVSLETSVDKLKAMLGNAALSSDETNTIIARLRALGVTV